MIRSAFRFSAGLAAVVTMWSCAGGDYGSGSSSTTPTAPTPTSSGSVTVSIVGSDGNQAFQPNPVQVAVGGTLMWRNNDTTTHRIVLDDGSADLGDLVPGATTRSVTVAGGNALNFHCTIHPTMVGSINGASAPLPPAPYGAGRAYLQSRWITHR